MSKANPTRPKAPCYRHKDTQGCFVCGETQGLHEHHIVPQAYGGTYGPTVILCGTHHTLVHDVGLKPVQRHEELMRQAGVTNPDQLATICQLSSCIAKARETFKANDISAKIRIELSREHSDMLRQVQVALGAGSQTVAIQRCIEIVHAQCFPLKRK